MEPPETARPVAYATYADELSARMRQAYTLVRENLGVAAKHNKRAYDLRVHAQTYKVGQWVRYFHPRKMANRQDKWRRNFNGPFLVVKVIGPVNVIIQRSKRAHPFCVHVDKLKPYIHGFLKLTRRPWVRHRAMHRPWARPCDLAQLREAKMRNNRQRVSVKHSR